MNSGERSSIDASRWPRVARTPDGFMLDNRSKWAADAFAATCARAGIARETSREGTDELRIEVRDEMLFDRIAEADWLGLGESYLAGEWDCERLPEALSKLLDEGLDGGPKGSMLRSMRTLARSRPQPEAISGGAELPTTLLGLIAGPNLATGSALFASGVRTTVQEMKTNHAPGAGRSGFPSKWPVHVTYIDPPKHVARVDFATAQLRRIDAMLDAGRVRAGDHVLVWPSTGGEVALRAADRGAGVDVLAVREDHAETILDRAEEAGLGGVVQVLRADNEVPSPREFDSDYEAIINVERLETFGKARLRSWLRNAERILTPEGTIVVQMAVATDTFDEAADSATDIVRSYIWPNLYYPTMENLRRIVDRDTGMRIAAETHYPGHYSETLKLNRDFFAACSRKAAGLGYDRVYRRLWDYHLALQQALVDTGRLNMVQLEIVKVSKRRR
ncbi:class I SAM-dependent methyltransferase [Corynebacterium sp. H78]|uniref:class I SAM-dependent methyltransferase n=1 Tax=Corynebacterium sp. H78 TaxID=3133417 RepID=UPI003098C181